jgi:preprotein translocase subunit SecE
MLTDRRAPAVVTVPWARTGSGGAPKGSGAIGSAPVSKTGGCGFESLLPCAPTDLQDDSERRPHTVTDTREGTTSPADRRRSGGFLLFLRQVVAELRKVVRPTRDELIAYTSVVLVFVVAVMTYIGVLDFGFGRLVLWVFGG